MKRKNKKPDVEWHLICRAISEDSVRISVPRAFLSTLTLFFHHVSDAMGGDDRPDHGLAKMRQGREYCRDPFYPVPQKAPSVKTGMNVDGFPEGFFPKAMAVKPWYGVYFLYGKLKRAEKKMHPLHYRKALQLFHQYHELQKVRYDL